MARRLRSDLPKGLPREYVLQDDENGYGLQTSVDKIGRKFPFPYPLTPYPSHLTFHGLTLPKAVCYPPRWLAPIIGKTDPHEHQGLPRTEAGRRGSVP